MKRLKIEATIDKLPQVLAHVDEVLEKLGSSIKLQMAIDLAVEEIFVNIANYAYENNVGLTHISIDCPERISEDGKKESWIEITFSDWGKPYNPLAKEDPDIGRPLQERGIGGLGIFLVKKKMDEVFYDYKDGQNVLTMRKRLL